MKKCKTCGHELPREKTLIIPELKLEIDTEDLHKGKSFNEIKKLIPSGKRLLKGWEAMFIWENYMKEANMEDCWFFVEPNKNGNVFRFNAYSDRAGLYLYWSPRVSYSALGVRFCKETK